MSEAARWQLDDHAAELYERHVVRYVLGPWVPLLLDVARLRPGDRVLDVACGTGAVARAAAQKVGASGAVTGLDANAGMLAVARSLCAPAGAPISWIRRDVVDTGLRAGSLDIVLCQQGLQFFPHRIAALREMLRVLAPAGRLAMSVWRTTGVYNAAVGAALGQVLGAEVAVLFCASRDVPSGEELVRITQAAGFKDVSLHVQRMIARLPSPAEFVLGHLSATPVASEVNALSAHDRAALGRSVAHRLAAYVEGEGLAFPEEVNVVTAQA